MNDKTTSMVDRILHIDFADEKDILLKWKRLWMGKFGKGAIRDRTIYLIKEDLKRVGVLPKDGR